MNSKRHGKAGRLGVWACRNLGLLSISNSSFSMYDTRNGRNKDPVTIVVFRRNSGEFRMGAALQTNPEHRGGCAPDDMYFQKGPRQIRVCTNERPRFHSCGWYLTTLKRSGWTVSTRLVHLTLSGQVEGGPSYRWAWSRTHRCESKATPYYQLLTLNW